MLEPSDWLGERCGAMIMEASETRTPDMDPRSRFLLWIGAVAGLIGFAVFNFAELSDDLLPVNRALLAAVCTLAVVWLLVSVSKTWGDRP